MEKLQAALSKARATRSGTPATARAKTGAPVWEAVQPMDLSKHALRKHHIVSQDASDAAIPFDIMRTKILRQMQQNGWTRLAITSPMPQCGKTTTACNLALGLGRQSGLRTILMDLDLRDPSIHKFFGQTSTHMINDVLTGEVSFGEQAQRIGENVLVSLSGKTEVDPTRILMADQTEHVLKDIEQVYAPDIMIFDLPSVLVGDNTRAFLKRVDCALIITRANATRYGHFDTCEREIAEHTNVLGVVLNAFRHGPAAHLSE